jgi:hypothetical protein
LPPRFAGSGNFAGFNFGLMGVQNYSSLVSMRALLDYVSMRGGGVLREDYVVSSGGAPAAAAP